MAYATHFITRLARSVVRLHEYLGIMTEVNRLDHTIRVPSDSCAQMLLNTYKWDLDMFQLYQLSDDSPMTAMGMKILTDFGLWETLHLNKVGVVCTGGKGALHH